MAVVEGVRENLGELGFVFVVAAVCIVFSVRTFSLEFESALAPWTLIVLTFLFLVLAVLDLCGIRERMGLAQKQVEETDELVDEYSYEMHVWGAVKAITAVFLTVISINYVGFFTTSFLFTAGFIFLFKDRQSHLRDAAGSIAIGFVVTLFFWHLFIEFFGATDLMRFGIYY